MYIFELFSTLLWGVEFLSSNFSLQDSRRMNFRVFLALLRTLNGICYTLSRARRKYEKATMLGRNCIFPRVVFQVSTNRQEPNDDFLVEIRQIETFYCDSLSDIKSTTMQIFLEDLVLWSSESGFISGKSSFDKKLCRFVILPHVKRGNL